MTLVQERPLLAQQDRAEEVHRRGRVEAITVFGLSFGAYFTVAMFLDFKYHSFFGDAISRMANGFYILHARDPHLAAVGFVWNPLSSIADLPLLTFNSLFPVLASHNVAGTTMSALAMACAVYQLHALLKEWGLSAAPRLILTALFALNPMILYFAGNGMSEALYLFCMIAAARYLCRWLKDGTLSSLTFSAIALGLGYLERTEPLAAAAFAVPLVLFVSYVRTSGERRHRIWTGLTDVTVFILPIVTSFVGWAVISFVLTGQPFQQFQSKYGNATLIAESHQKFGTLSSRLAHEATAVTSMAPLLIVIVVVAIIVAIVRRNIGILGVVTLLGGGLGFTMASYLVNAIFPWYRYYILVAPIEVLLVASMFAEPAGLLVPSPIPLSRQPSSGRAKKTALGTLGACVVALVLLGPALPSTGRAMTNISLAPDVMQYTSYFFFPKYPLNTFALQGKTAYSQVLSMSRYLEAQHFQNGDVVSDNANGCIPNVDTNLTNPRVLIIHNDRDFQRVLADPLVFHAHYLLVGLASTNDAVLAAYPNIGKGTPWAKLVHTFSYPYGGACDGYRLFKVVGHPNENF